MAYELIEWKNGETAINQDNLNHMDEGVFKGVAAYDAILQQLSEAINNCLDNENLRIVIAETEEGLTITTVGPESAE